MLFASLLHPLPPAPIPRSQIDSAVGFLLLQGFPYWRGLHLYSEDILAARPPAVLVAAPYRLVPFIGLPIKDTFSPLFDSIIIIIIASKNQ